MNNIMKPCLRLALLLLLGASLTTLFAFAGGLQLTDATIADLNSVFMSGALSSEKLVSLYLRRIEGYDEQGPSINAVITLNSKALAMARTPDLERGTMGPRSPIHGIPIVLMDNIDTFDLATTHGSLLLKGSILLDDAFVVKKLRAVPLALTLDSGGPMARSIYDLAVALGIMTGVDPADPATRASAGKFETDYTRFLRKGSLKGARIGVGRQFFGQDTGTDHVMEWTVLKLKELGATLVDPLNVPAYILAVKSEIYDTVRSTEFPRQLGDYLATLRPEYPRSLADLRICAKTTSHLSGAKHPVFALESTWPNSA